jgi:hypothetical protein
MGQRDPFATQQFLAAHVRFGSKADIAVRPRNVCFTPESRHSSAQLPCPLCAKSGHSPPRRCPEMTAGGRLLRVTVEGTALRHILRALARHRRSVWRTEHTAWSKLPPRHLVLGQPLFIAGCFTIPVRRPVWFRCHHKNLKGLDFAS